MSWTLTEAKPIDVWALKPLETSNNVGFQEAPAFALSDKAKALRILLLEPLYDPQAVWGSAKTEQGYIPPMGTIAVYNWLRHRGYNVDLIDTQFNDISPEELRTRLNHEQYDIVALPSFTPTADFVFQTARIVKGVLPNSKVVFGGIHASTLPKACMDQCPDCDFIIRHEAEHTMDEFLSAFASGDHDWSQIQGLCYRDKNDQCVINSQRPFIRNLDSLPAGFYSDIELAQYVPHATQYLRLPSYPVITQRGCPYSCTYCQAAQILGKKTRFFSVDRVIEELKILKYEKGAKGVFFQDSTFTIKKKWTMELMNRMVKEDLGLLWSCTTRTDRVDPELLDAMFSAGGRQIFLGIESGNQESLDLVKKGVTVEQQTQGVKWIREAGFRYLCSFIICLPNETEEMVQNTIDYAKSLGGHTGMFYLPVPYPGTELFDKCNETGGLKRMATWSDFISIDFENPVYVNPIFGVEGMRYWYKRAWMEYYSSPGIWWANLKLMRSFEDYARFARGGKALLSIIGHDLSGFLKTQYRGFHGQGAPTEMRDAKASAADKN